jgi:hypothetical protein
MPEPLTSTTLLSIESIGLFLVEGSVHCRRAAAGPPSDAHPADPIKIPLAAVALTTAPTNADDNKIPASTRCSRQPQPPLAATSGQPQPIQLQASAARRTRSLCDLLRRTPLIQRKTYVIGLNQQHAARGRRTNLLE